ncbi:MAG: hypothetical protein Q8M07_22400 [Prosthecobacter sp.]|nr:hypothetical protein [Prosthecobacter sp.]
MNKARSLLLLTALLGGAVVRVEAQTPAPVPPCAAAPKDGAALLASRKAPLANKDALTTLNAPLGTLEFAAIHEAGHVVAAKAIGLSVTRAMIFQRSKPGVGVYWKGTTQLRGGTRGMAVAKLGGHFAERFLDDRTNKVIVPSFLDVISNRNIISESDVITQADLGADSLQTAQHKTYRALAGNVAMLSQVYNQLRTRHVYP